jgi:hypothetical protein
MRQETPTITASEQPRRSARTERWIATLIGLEAASLAVMSAVHLTGTLAGGTKPYEPADAGIAEALICLALTGGAIALARGWPHARRIASGTLAFAILGFLVGLAFTVRGSHAIDVGYHLTVLPLLLLTLLRLRKRLSGRRSPISSQTTPT